MMAKRKLNLDKLEIDKESIGFTEYSRGIRSVAIDIDVPTINDNCCARILTTYNTVVTCEPDDWCGYLHESDCWGPTLTRIK
jgi:hypothetical protein